MTIVNRETKETRIQLELLTGNGGASAISTTVPFLDHMLVTLARYSGLTINVEATGDLRHHIIEDVAIALGMAIRQAMPASAVRYGDCTIPMDDALVPAVLDTGGRPYYRGPIPSSLYDHFMRSLSDNAECTLHIRVLRGTDRHHIVEGAFKAVGVALGAAIKDSGSGVVFSTKGAVSTKAES
jgi:imidazoleglycerol-phosphate dehydratase